VCQHTDPGMTLKHKDFDPLGSWSLHFHKYMSLAESHGSHSLNSFAYFLQLHLDSPEASSCRISRVKPIRHVKPIIFEKPMDEDNVHAHRRGGRQRRHNTTLDLPPNLYEKYKSDPEETNGQ